jgi:hypothetical protein
MVEVAKELIYAVVEADGARIWANCCGDMVRPPPEEEYEEVGGVGVGVGTALVTVTAIMDEVA